MDIEKVADQKYTLSLYFDSSTDEWKLNHMRNQIIQQKNKNKILMNVYTLAKSMKTSQQLSNFFQYLKDLQYITNFELIVHEKHQIEEEIFIYISDLINSLLNLSTLNIQINAHDCQNTKNVILIENLDQQKLKSLTIMMRNTQIKDESIYKLNKLIIKLTHIQEIRLIIQETNLTEHGIYKLGTSLKNLNTLKKLTLSMSFISGTKGFQGFRKGLINKELEILFLYIGKQVQLNLEQSQLISQVIESLNNLTTLSIHISNQSEFNYQCTEILGNSISRLVNLQNLTIIVEKNNIQSLGAAGLGLALNNLNQLKFLKLHIDDGNNIKQEGIIELLKYVNSLQNLEEVQIQLFEHILLDENGYQKFLLPFKELERLEKLCLVLESQLSMNKNEFKYFSQCLRCLTNLKYLQLCLGFSSNINSASIISIGNAISNLSKFQQIYLTFSFEGDNDEYLITFMKSFQHLKNLNQLRLITQGLYSKQSTMLQICSILNQIKKLNTLQIVEAINLHLSDIRLAMIRKIKRLVISKS